MSPHIQDRTAALSGPISKGDQAANMKAFEVARSVLLSEGHPAFPYWREVHTPLANPKALDAAAESAALIAAREDYRRGGLYMAAVRWYAERILRSDVLFVLPGWETSHGARGEVWLAAYCGIDVRAWSDNPTLRVPLAPDLRLMTAGEIDAVHSDGFRQGCVDA